MVSVGQKSGNSLAGRLWLGVSNKAAIKVFVRAIVTSRFNWGKIHFQNHSCSYWWDSGLLWLLAKHTLPYRPLHRTPHTWQPTASEHASKRRESMLETEAVIFSEMYFPTCHRLCHILCDRSRSLNPAHAPGEVIAQGHAYQEVEIL